MFKPDESITFTSGVKMKNRFALAPMTNHQSHEDGSLSDDEFHWLTKRAEGQFGMVMTCASHVQKNGQGFPGQLGIFSDELMDGHKRLASAIRQHGSLAVIQLHHAGMRSPEDLIGEPPVCPSSNEKFKARELSTEEVEALREDFIQAAIRAKQCDYDGVEIHGAHGYILAQFLSPEINKRKDQYGGSFENRCRLTLEIISGIGESCGPDFLLGLRLSPERFGLDIAEIKQFCQQLINDGKVDFLDISLWDVFKMPEEEKYQEKSLLQHFTSLDWAKVKLTVAGKIRSAQDVSKVLEAGVDFVSIGRAGILHHDFPIRVINDPNFTPVTNPVSEAYLRSEGLGQKFVDYMKRWPNFVEGH
jgi:2,4-dienoyl-CoA reductase-like NADH-dependent reductase (Old Yellow Enzyme family)